MKKFAVFTLAALATLCVMLWPGLSTVAQARPVTQSQTFAVASRAEVAAALLPAMLEQAGYEVVLADARLAGALQDSFLGSDEFQWSKTVVTNLTARAGISVTLPTDVSRLQEGVVALGIIENNRLARAFELTMDLERSGGFHLTVATPAGKVVQTMDVGVSRSGSLLASKNQLSRLATVFFPMLSGVFDPLIDILNEIINILYMVRDIINMAICAVEEAIDLLNNLNACGWGNVSPGGGMIFNLVVCTIEDIIAFVQDLTGRCF